MSRWWALTAALLVSCGNPLGSKPKAEDAFHPGVPAPAGTPDATPPAPAPLGGDPGFKLGPGGLRSAGPATALRAAITNDAHRVSGTHISARLSLNRKELR